MPDAGLFPKIFLHSVFSINLGGLNVPVLESLGLGNIRTITGVAKTKTPKGQYGVMKMKSKGKDTTTGHWELMGLVLDKPFKTYKKFPDELINKQRIAFKRIAIFPGIFHRANSHRIDYNNYCSFFHGLITPASSFKYSKCSCWIASPGYNMPIPGG